MNYKETINYLYALLPMYQKVGVAAIKKNLTNITSLCQSLGNPQNHFQSIHIGGTNGKGTVSHMISSILQEAGYKVGLYTSPHYIDFRERIKINGQYIPEEYVIQFVKEMSKNIESVKPSFFEMTVAMAFQYFKDESVDYSVVEVGLGGRLDSTNILSPLLSVITNIGLDHQNMLGDTLGEIASEKAGIIKRSTPVIIGEHDDITAPIFINKAKEEQALITFANKEWASETNSKKSSSTFSKNQLYFKIESDYNNPFQSKNIITALEAVSNETLNLSQEEIVNGIEKFKENANYIGRWQQLGSSPDIIADSGHNAHALGHSLLSISKMNYSKIHFVLGFVKDKDVNKMLKLFPKSEKYYFAKPNITRGAEVYSFKHHIELQQLEYQQYISLSSALKAAKRCAKSDDLIFVGGSSFVVGEVLSFNLETK